MRLPPMLSATTLPPVESDSHFTRATMAMVAATARPMVVNWLQLK